MRTLPSLALALSGALVFGACSGSDRASAGDAGGRRDSGGTVPVDPGSPFAADGGSQEDSPYGPSLGVDGAVACDSRSGYFGCGTNLCSRAVQACTGDLCEWYGDLGAACGLCPTCACLRASALNIHTCDDDGSGGITFTVYDGLEGDPCRSDTDCSSSECIDGACHCIPAGAPLPDSGAFACCSGWQQGGVCSAQAGSGCTTRVPDCYGGTCSQGTCTCVGAGGYCNADTDCCAGTSRCVQQLCQ